MKRTAVTAYGSVVPFNAHPWVLRAWRWIVTDTEQNVEVVVLGSFNTDLTVNVPRLPRMGETVMGGAFYRAAGGKGANQAVAAARAGARTAFIGCVGEDDFGRAARENLAREEIELSGLHVDKDAPSGVALILVDGEGRNVIAVAPGANARLHAGHVEAAAPLIRGARVLLLQLEVPVEAVTRAAETAEAGGTAVLLNPAPVPERPLSPDLLARTAVLVANEEEAVQLTRSAGAGAGDPEGTARALLALGPRSVVITLGRRGGLVFERGKAPWSYPARKVDAVDTVGAGDCFCGWLAAGLARGKELRESTAVAALAAAVSVTRRGAQPSMPRPEEVRGFRG